MLGLLTLAHSYVIRHILVWYCTNGAFVWCPRLTSLYLSTCIGDWRSNIGCSGSARTGRTAASWTWTSPPTARRWAARSAARRPRAAAASAARTPGRATCAAPPSPSTTPAPSNSRRTLSSEINNFFKPITDTHNTYFCNVVSWYLKFHLTTRKLNNVITKLIYLHLPLQCQIDQFLLSS